VNNPKLNTLTGDLSENFSTSKSLFFPYYEENWPVPTNVYNSLCFSRDAGVNPVFRPDSLGEKTESENKSNHYKTQIKNLLETAGKPNWDGEGADPVMEGTVQFAQKILEKIEDNANCKGLEISVDPFGRIDFDWHLDDGTMFTVSVGKDKDLVVSGLKDGYSNLSGTEHWKEGGNNFSMLECGLKWFTEAQR